MLLLIIKTFRTHMTGKSLLTYVLHMHFVHYVPRTLRALVSYVPRTLSVLVLHVSRASRSLRLTCSLAWCHTFPRT